MKKDEKEFECIICLEIQEPISLFRNEDSICYKCASNPKSALIALAERIKALED